MTANSIVGRGGPPLDNNGNSPFGGDYDIEHAVQIQGGGGSQLVLLGRQIQFGRLHRTAVHKHRCMEMVALVVVDPGFAPGGSHLGGDLVVGRIRDHLFDDEGRVHFA